MHLCSQLHSAALHSVGIASVKVLNVTYFKCFYIISRSKSKFQKMADSLTGHKKAQSEGDKVSALDKRDSLCTLFQKMQGWNKYGVTQTVLG